MLKIGNLKSTEEALKEYIANGDYSRSFVMAGWKDIGKSYLVHKAKKHSSLKTQSFSLMGKQGKDRAIESLKIFNLATAPKNEPTVIIVNINLESSLRGLLKNGLDIHLVRYDDKEQHNWLDNPEKQEGLSQSDIKLFKELASIVTPPHKNVEKTQIIQEKIVKILSRIEKYFNNYQEDGEKIPDSLKELYEVLYFLFIAKNDVLDYLQIVKDLFEWNKSEREDWITNEMLLTFDSEVSQDEKDRQIKEAREKDKEEQELFLKTNTSIESILAEFKKEIEEDFF